MYMGSLWHDFTNTKLRSASPGPSLRQRRCEDPRGPEVHPRGVRHAALEASGLQGGQGAGAFQTCRGGERWRDFIVI